MSENNHPGGLRPWSSATYRIEIEGRLPDTYAEEFGEMQTSERCRSDGSFVTCLIGRFADQAALTGMLDGLSELHLPILVVERVMTEIDEDGDRRA